MQLTITFTTANDSFPTGFEAEITALDENGIFTYTAQAPNEAEADEIIRELLHEFGNDILSIHVER